MFSHYMQISIKYIRHCDRNLIGLDQHQEPEDNLPSDAVPKPTTRWRLPNLPFVQYIILPPRKRTTYF